MLSTQLAILRAVQTSICFRCWRSKALKDVGKHSEHKRWSTCQPEADKRNETIWLKVGLFVGRSRDWTGGKHTENNIKGNIREVGSFRVCSLELTENTGCVIPVALGAVGVICGCRAPEEVTRGREAQQLPPGAELFMCSGAWWSHTYSVATCISQKLIPPEKLEKTKGKPQRLEQASGTTPLQSASQHTGHRVGETHAMAVGSL